MLESQDGGGYQYGSLLAVATGLESGPDSYFGLPESYISTYQTVHRRRELHIFVHFRDGTLFPRILRDLVQGIDIDIQDIAVPVNDTDGFLQPAVGFDLLQPAVDAHSMIDMGHIISGLQFPQRSQGDRLILIISLLNLVFMVTLE